MSTSKLLNPVFYARRKERRLAAAAERAQQLTAALPRIEISQTARRRRACYTLVHKSPPVWRYRIPDVSKYHAPTARQREWQAAGRRHNAILAAAARG